MKNILEIGCGQGFNSYLLSKKKNNKVIGIDMSKENIDVSKKRYPGVDFRVENSEKINFCDNYFDEVYAIDVLEHVDNLDKVSDEITRILKIGGKLIVFVPAEKSEKWLLKIRPSYFQEIHHVRIFKGDDLKNRFERRGLVMSKKRSLGFLQHIELFYLFSVNKQSNTQLGIGNWRDSLISKMIHILLLFFDPVILKTPLKYFPLYLVTVPIGCIINFFGNFFFPKSISYEFIKNG